MTQATQIYLRAAQEAAEEQGAWCKHCGCEARYHRVSDNACPGAYPADHPFVLHFGVVAGDMWPMQFSSPYAQGTRYAPRSRTRVLDAWGEVEQQPATAVDGSEESCPDEHESQD